MSQQIYKINLERTNAEPTGEFYLVAGEKLAMRAWEYDDEQPEKEWDSHQYEVVGFVIEGAAELLLEDRVVELEPGDSWIVPANARHKYRIDGLFKCIEVTHPPTHDAPV